MDDLLDTWGMELGRGVLVDLQDRVAQGEFTMPSWSAPLLTTKLLTN